MKNYNRYRGSQFDEDRYEDRNDRFNDRFGDYNDSGRGSGQNYDRQYGQDFNRSNYNDPMSNSGSYSSFNDREGYGYGDRNRGSRQDYDSGSRSSSRGLRNDNNYDSSRNYNRNYGTGNYGNNWSNDDWRSDNRGENDNRRSDNWRGNDYNDRQDRGWWDRTTDEVSSWFGDEDAKRRRRMDEIRDHRGKGPKNYQRSTDRIKEDVNDKLSDSWMLDASNIEVEVNGSEVTLTGTVSSRQDKRKAEDIAEDVSGVSHVQNNLRVSTTTGEETADTDKNKPYNARTRKNELHHN